MKHLIFLSLITIFVNNTLAEERVCGYLVDATERSFFSDYADRLDRLLIVNCEELKEDGYDSYIQNYSAAVGIVLDDKSENTKKLDKLLSRQNSKASICVKGEWKGPSPCLSNRPYLGLNKEVYTLINSSEITSVEYRSGRKVSL